MYVHVYRYVHIKCKCPLGPEEGIRCLGLEFHMVVSCGCWELNQGSLEEQQVVLTAEPFL